MKKRILSLLFCFAMLVSLITVFSVPVFATPDQSVFKFIDENGVEKFIGGSADSGTVSAQYTVVTDSISPVNWSAGWYVVSGNATIHCGITCNGTVNLLLCDGAALTVGADDFQIGINIAAADTVLNVFGQKAGTGSLIVGSGGYGCPAIGADFPTPSPVYFNLYGGNVTATGSSAPAIGPNMLNMTYRGGSLTASYFNNTNQALPSPGGTGTYDVSATTIIRMGDSADNLANSFYVQDSQGVKQAFDDSCPKKVITFSQAVARVEIGGKFQGFETLQAAADAAVASITDVGSEERTIYLVKDAYIDEDVTIDDSYMIDFNFDVYHVYSTNGLSVGVIDEKTGNIVLQSRIQAVYAGVKAVNLENTGFPYSDAVKLISECGIAFVKDDIVLYAKSGNNFIGLQYNGTDWITLSSSLSLYNVKNSKNPVYVIGSVEYYPSYNVTVNAADNGTVSVDTATMYETQEVKLTVAPKAGYALKNITVTKTDESTVETEINVSDMTFIMPGYAVTVTPVFYELAVKEAATGAFGDSMTKEITGIANLFDLSPKALEAYLKAYAEDAENANNTLGYFKTVTDSDEAKYQAALLLLLTEFETVKEDEDRLDHIKCALNSDVFLKAFQKCAEKFSAADSDKKYVAPVYNGVLCQILDEIGKMVEGTGTFPIGDFYTYLNTLLTQKPKSADDYAVLKSLVLGMIYDEEIDCYTEAEATTALAKILNQMKTGKTVAEIFATYHVADLCTNGSTEEQKTAACELAVLIKLNLLTSLYRPAYFADVFENPDDQMTAKDTYLAYFTSDVYFKALAKIIEAEETKAPLAVLSTVANLVNPVNDEVGKYCNYDRTGVAVMYTADIVKAFTLSLTKEETENGSFTLAETALAGDTVTLAYTPDDGYRFDTVTVYKTGDKNTKVNVSNDAFTMPEYPVTVEVAFTKTDATLFAEYKTAKKGDLDELGTDINSVIADAKTSIDTLAFDDGKSLDDNEAAIDAIVVLAAEKYQSLKTFGEYKIEKKAALDALGADINSIIANAKAQIDTLAFDDGKSLADNKAAVDSLVSAANTDYETARKSYQPTIIEGAKQTVNLKVKDTVATFRSEANFDEFVKVTVDGEEVDAKNYDAVSGSILVTLHNDYLKTLKKGDHEISIVSTNGHADSTFTVEKAASLVWLWILLGILGLLIILYVAGYFCYRGGHMDGTPLEKFYAFLPKAAPVAAATIETVKTPEELAAEKAAREKAKEDAELTKTANHFADVEVPVNYEGDDKLEVCDICFIGRKKLYRFAVNGLTLKAGDKVLVKTTLTDKETVGMIIHGNYAVKADEQARELKPVLSVKE